MDGGVGAQKADLEPITKPKPTGHCALRDPQGKKDDVPAWTDHSGHLLEHGAIPGRLVVLDGELTAKRKVAHDRARAPVGQIDASDIRYPYLPRADVGSGCLHGLAVDVGTPWLPAGSLRFGQNGPGASLGRQIRPAIHPGLSPLERSVRPTSTKTSSARPNSATADRCPRSTSNNTTSERPSQPMSDVVTPGSSSISRATSGASPGTAMANMRVALRRRSECTAAGVRAVPGSRPGSADRSSPGTRRNPARPTPSCARAPASRPASRCERAP